jgi:hypothetical protein
VDASAFDAIDLQGNHAVVEQQDVARLDVLVQRVQGNPDTLLGSIFETERTIEEERCAVLQLHGPFLEPLHPNLRSLEIAQQTHVALALASRLTKLLRAATMLRRLAVRKIDAGDIEPGVDHFPQRLLMVGRRSQRRHDLGPSLHGGDYCILVCRSYGGIAARSTGVTSCHYSPLLPNASRIP